MDDKISEFFFDIFLPILVGCGSLYIWTTLHGDERANSAFILISLFFVCMHCLYKNMLKLFKSK